MTPKPKRAGSFVVNGALASAVLYHALDLSSSGRTLIDWTVITLVTLAIAWNVVGLSLRLRVLGGKAVWHVQRTVLFWIIGLLNTVFRAPGATTDWKYVIGVVLLVVAAVDTIALWRKEHRLVSSGPGMAAGGRDQEEQPS